MYSELIKFNSSFANNHLHCDANGKCDCLLFCPLHQQKLELRHLPQTQLAVLASRWGGKMSFPEQSGSPWRTTCYNFLKPHSSPEESLNRVCTYCSQPSEIRSIRFPDDWWTWIIGSQLLYPLRANWITLRGHWLLCYGMHHGKLSNLLPGARLPLPKPYQISSIALMKSLMSVSSWR